MRHPLLEELRRLDLPKGDWALFGSGPLLTRRWISDVGDLDVVARDVAWAKAQRLGPVSHLGTYDVDIVTIGDHITVGTRWGVGEVSTDRVIDTAEEIDGVPCVRLEHVVAYKRILNRPKDLVHIRMIERHGFGPSTSGDCRVT